MAAAVLLLFAVLLTGSLAHSNAGASELSLHWTDNSNNEAGFKIERRVGASGSFVQVAVLAPNAGSYADWGLTGGDTYCYRIRAFNSAGHSAYSNEACGVATRTGEGEPQIVTAPGPGGGPHVRGFTDAGSAAGTSFMAYAPAFAGGGFVTVGRVNGALALITAAGPGGGPHVQAFALDGSPSGLSFMAYDARSTHGTRVASCDVDGDGQAEIITAPGPGGGPHVRVWRVTGITVSLLSEFFAYHSGFTGGVFVACGDVDGDGSAEVITAAGPGGGPHVVVWRIAPGAVPTAVASFFSYHPSFRGGVTVAAGDLDDDGRAEIITGAGPRGGPHVVAWRISGGGAVAPVVSFFAYDPAFAGGVHVGVVRRSSDGRMEIVTGAGAGGGPHVRTFTVVGPTAIPHLSFFAYDPGFRGGVVVGGSPP